MQPHEEKEWQHAWEQKRIFEADPAGERKMFVNAPYPYLNGPLHLGHAFTYARLDCYARYWRMNGYNVLFPFAFHATGEPIVGVAKRLQAKDPKQIAILKESGIGEKELEKFADPNEIVAYYKKQNQKLAAELGFSIDWRRSFTTIDPAYQKFITWQYLRLGEKGYVAQGTHPVIWCPGCRSPTGDHDRLEGEGVSPVEYTLLKFRFGKDMLVAATLRPETIYGVTNIWVHPKTELVRAQVGTETWIISASAASKLSEQQKAVKILCRINPKELVGKQAENPVTKAALPILPAPLVDPDHATGVVMSVPAHAPFDYMALQDLARDGKLPHPIPPIAVVDVPELGPIPAKTVCEKHGITSQSDSKLENATRELYKKEFHAGIMAKNTGPYAGKKITEIKDRLVADFKKQGADRMYETESRVVCRSNDVCIVKILENQWFLTYSNPKWKELVRENLSRLTLFPEDIRPAFQNTIEWLQDKACARKSGLGTKLPWDQDWIVETLSDSTIYMAFYTIAHVIASRKIAAEQLRPEVFDYVFWGTKKSEAVKHVPEGVLDAMRTEFEFWYPVDLRITADELVSNHLTFYLFHHTALFPARQWPCGISVNGMVMVEGEKMSKSKGNFITVQQALHQYGADVTRAGLMVSAEGLSQPNWSASGADAMKAWLNRLKVWCAEKHKPEEGGRMDQWLMSRMQKHVRKAREAYETARFRTALQAALFEPVNDIRWYLRRTEPRDALPYALDLVTRMVAPVAPHTAEDCWKLLGNEPFVSTAEFPTSQSDEEDNVVEVAEQIVRQTIDDIAEVQKIVGKPAKAIRIYVSAPWKYEVYRGVLEGSQDKGIVAKFMQDPEIRKHGNDVIRLVEKLRKSQLLELPGREEELNALQDAAHFFTKEFGCPVEVHSASESMSPKALRAEPGKPGIELVTE